MWLLVLVPVFLSVTTDERHLVDFLLYRRAAEALVRGDSPYAPPEQARATWLVFYQLEADSTETPTRAPTAANCIRTDSDSATTACLVTL